jgi:hypothetical protein
MHPDGMFRGVAVMRPPADTERDERMTHRSVAGKCSRQVKRLL